MSLIKEFKEFALRGNVLDLAIGFVVGAAFGKIVTSLVDDIILPPVGKALGNVNFSDLFISLDSAKTVGIASLAEAKKTGAAVIAYGAFVSTVIDFLIVAFCIFLVIKGINSFKRKPAAPAGPAPPEPTRQEKLLTEIRDLLKSRA